jgi:hypothetical protein
MAYTLCIKSTCSHYNKAVGHMYVCVCVCMHACMYLCILCASSIQSVRLWAAFVAYAQKHQQVQSSSQQFIILLSLMMQAVRVHSNATYLLNSLISFQSGLTYCRPHDTSCELACECHTASLMMRAVSSLVSGSCFVCTAAPRVNSCRC